MRIKRTATILLFTTICMITTVIAQPEKGMPDEPGSCFARCFVPQQTHGEWEYYYRFTGQKLPISGVEKVVFTISEPTTQWVKKVVDNCQSQNPGDCIVWCVSKVPAVEDTVQEVTDTSVVKDYVLDSIELIYVDDEGGYTEWEEVICEIDITNDLIRKVQESLVSYGHHILITGEFDASTKEALIQFQKANEYRTGALTIEILDVFEIEY